MKILIANQFPAFRQAIATLLRMNFDIAVIGEAEDGADALQLLRSDAWDIAILGARLPFGGGLHYLSQFKAERPSLPVSMVGFEAFPIVVGSCLHVGACGYVM